MFLRCCYGYLWVPIRCPDIADFLVGLQGLDDGDGIFLSLKPWSVVVTDDLDVHGGIVRNLLGGSSISCRDQQLWVKKKNANVIFTMAL